VEEYWLYGVEGVGGRIVGDKNVLLKGNVAQISGDKDC